MLSFTIRAVPLVASGTAATGAIPVKVAALAEGVMKAMMLTKLKSAMAGLLMIAAAVVGLGGSLCWTLAAGPGEPKAQSSAVPNGAEKLKTDKVQEALKRAVQEAERDVEDAEVLFYRDHFTGAKVDDDTDNVKRLLALPVGAVARLGSARWRHGGFAGFVAFLPAGHRVISADDERVIHVWEYPAGKEIQRFGPGLAEAPSPQGRLVHCQLPVALSPDGKFVASLFEGDLVRVFEVATGKEVTTLKGRGDFSSNVAFSPDGRQLAVRDGTRTITIWDWADAKQVWRLDLDKKDKKNTALQTSSILAYSPTGALAAPTFQDTISVLDPTKGRQICGFTVPAGMSVHHACFSPDGKLLAFVTDDDVIHVMEIAGAKERYQVRGKRGSYRSMALAFSKDGKSLFARSARSGIVHEIDVNTGKDLRGLGEVGKQDWPTGHFVATPALSPDGKVLAFAGISHSLHFFDLVAGKEVYRTGTNTAGLKAVGWCPNGKSLWTQGRGSSLRQWESIGGKELEPIHLPVDSGDATVSPNARFLVTDTRGHATGRIIDIATSKTIGHVEPRKELGEGYLWSMAFSPDGARLALRWEKEKKIELYDPTQAKLLHVFNVGDPSEPLAQSNLGSSPMMVFSADGKLLAAYSRQDVVSLWDTGTGRERTSLLLKDAMPVVAGAFSPDSRSLALDMNDGSVRLWELATGQERMTVGAKAEQRQPPKYSRSPLVFLDHLTNAPVTVAFAPRGNLVAYAGLDRVVRLWNVLSGKEVVAFHGHVGAISALAFAPDGKALASASTDTTVLIWDLTRLSAQSAPQRVLPQKELQSCWEALQSGDSRKAFAALVTLVGTPGQTPKLLNQHLQPAQALHADRVKQWISQLDDLQFDVREKATAELLKLDANIVPLIDKTVTAKLPLEQRRRLERIRDALTTFTLTGEKLRAYRAIEVLEHLGTPDAQQLLQRLAVGAPGALTTTAAQSALQRLKTLNISLRKGAKECE